MKALLHPVPIACLLMAAVGAVLDNVPMVVLSLVCGLAGMGFISARRPQDSTASAVEDLSGEARTMIVPLRRLVGDIEKLSEDNRASETLHALGKEALAEARKMFDQVVRSMLARDEVRKLTRGRYEAERELGQARIQLEFASSSERVALNAAIQARTAEIGHYDEIDRSVRLIELGLSQAEAILAEMKARLSVTISGERLAKAQNADIREAISRLHAISETFGEAEQIIRG